MYPNILPANFYTPEGNIILPSTNIYQYQLPTLPSFPSLPNVVFQDRFLQSTQQPFFQDRFLQQAEPMIPSTYLEPTQIAKTLTSGSLDNLTNIVTPPTFTTVTEKYQILNLLGKGGQGAVYKAVKDGKIIALKVIDITDKNAEQATREIRALEKISQPECHPFLACYYNHFLDQMNRKLYIEMEYLEGKMLFPQWSSQFSGEFLYSNLLLVMDDLCTALMYVHSKGIIHRDIKPNNILISNENIPKLIDFGISCFTINCSSPGGNDMQCCKKDPGTLQYMAPETYVLRESYFTTDVWGLGVSIYVAATGFYPFNFTNARTIDDFRNIVVNQPIVPINTPNLRFNRIINSCLNKDYLTRISVEELQKLVRSVF